MRVTTIHAAGDIRLEELPVLDSEFDSMAEMADTIAEHGNLMQWRRFINQQVRSQ